MDRLTDYLFNLEIGQSRVEKQIGIHADKAYRALSDGKRSQALRELTQIQQLAKKHGLRHRNQIQRGAGRTGKEYDKVPDVASLKLYDLAEAPFAGFSAKSDKTSKSEKSMDLITEIDEEETEDTETDEVKVSTDETDDTETDEVKVSTDEEDVEIPYRKHLPSLPKPSAPPLISQSKPRPVSARITGPPKQAIKYSKLPDKSQKKEHYRKVKLDPALRDFYKPDVDRTQAIQHLKKNPEVPFILRDVSDNAKKEKEVTDMASLGFRPFIVFTKDNPDTVNVIIYTNDKGEYTAHSHKDIKFPKLIKSPSLIEYLKETKNLPKHWH